jgi:chloramphenicol 3-O phosphotransferase
MDVGHHDDLPNSEWPFHRCYSLLTGLPVLLVAVRCDPAEIISRRIASDTMPKDLSPQDAAAKFEDWDTKVHASKTYHLEVNTTSQSPLECAADIQTHLQALHNG